MPPFRRAAAKFLLCWIATAVHGGTATRKVHSRSLQLLAPENVTITYHDDGLEAVRENHNAMPVAICLIVRDEDVREWVQHHESIGVDRIYIYDDQSNPPLLGTLMDDINTGLVHYRFTQRNRNTGIQEDTYTQCLKEHGHQHDWMGFLDADEYIVVHDRAFKRDINSFLRQYSDFGGLAVNWRVYGSGGHLYWPHASQVTGAASTLKTYTRCTPEDHGVNLHIKTFAQPRYTVAAGNNPHYFIYEEGYFAVSPDRTQVTDAFSAKVQVSQISCNHYLARSWSEWLVKLARGNADDKPRHGFNTFNVVNRACSMYCPYDE